MGLRRAHENRIVLAVALNVIDVIALAFQKAEILAPKDGLANAAGLFFCICHGLSSPPAFDAASMAFTML